MIILKSKNEIIDKVISLWMDSFGDTKNAVEQFFDAFENEVECCLLMEKERLISMACLIPCKLKIAQQEFNIIYLYAMCTNKPYRGQGKGTLLLKEIKEYCKEKFDAIALMPADKGLVSFYEKAGYESFFVNEQINDNSIIYSEKYLKYIDQIGVSPKDTLSNGMILRFNNEIELNAKPYMAYPMN